MQEIEAKFPDIAIEDIRQRLKDNQADLVMPMRIMHRAVFDNDYMKERNGFLRVRDEGDKTTITYKQFNPDDASDVLEQEITTDNFDSALQLFARLGIQPRSIQESKRETWSVNGCEVVIDIWPWLNPYVEIEGKTWESVKQTADLLGFRWSDALFGDVMAAYRHQYPHLGSSDTIGSIASVTFDSELPDLLKIS